MQSRQKELSTRIDSECLVINPGFSVPNLVDDVRSGLLNTPRKLPPKYFYDDYGSQLFSQICKVPEYYPTRVEDGLLEKHAVSIINDSLPSQIVELGSGTSTKTRRLLDACETLSHHCSYAPFDVCEEVLIQTAVELQSDYSWLHVSPLLGDYHAGLENLPVNEHKNLFVFLGSTIGNFEPEEFDVFISDIRDKMTPSDFFLIGVDRVKNKEVLNAAYNDTQGLTAQFNLNVLSVLNRELGADFDLSKFRHLSYFNESKNQIEMYLVSGETHEIQFNTLKTSILMHKDERILTEISRKFEIEDFTDQMEKHNFERLTHYQPENEYFSLLLFKCN